MKYVWIIIVGILTFLAVTSGITKVMLMPQDVDFFGKYGFSNPVLMVYGAAQIIGGVLLPFKQTRFIGALIIAITFAISLVVLMLDGNIPVSIVTTIAIAVLGLVAMRSRQKYTA